jgi:hypothetical protein
VGIARSDIIQYNWSGSDCSLHCGDDEVQNVGKLFELWKYTKALFEMQMLHETKD